MKAKRILSLLVCVCVLCGLLTSVSVSAAETENKLLYGFETEEDLNAVTCYNNAECYRSNLHNTSGSWSLHFGGPADNSGITWDGTGEAASYISIDLTGKLQNAMTLNVRWFDVGNGAVTAYERHGAAGITVGGKNYWVYRPDIYSAWGLYEFTGQTYYADTNDTTSESITLTDKNLSDVTAILFFVKTADYYHLLDDISADFRTTPAMPTASFDIDGVADIESDSDGNVVLPSAAVAGKQFIGWRDAEDNLYKAGTTVNLTADTAFSAVTVELALQRGAGIRWAKYESERGIRFETYVTKATLDTLGSSRCEIGALILPYADYNANITVDTATDYGAVNVVDPKVYGEVGENYHYYCGVVDFEKYFEVSQGALADLKLTAVSYLKVTYSDQSTECFYDYPDESDNVRTVAQVARAALADTEAGYTDTQKEILKLYTKYSAYTPADDAVTATYNMTELADSTRLIGRGEYVGDTLVCDWTTSGFETGAIFQGELTLDFSLSGAQGMIGVVIDEDYDNMHVIRADSTSTSATIQTELLYEYHKIRVIKLNECDSNTNSVVFKSLTFAGELATKPAEKALKIEVIGDSITCGAGNIPTETAFGFFEDGSKTYASFLARKLDADLNVIARFGWGLSYSWGGDTSAAVPLIWDKTIPRSDSTKTWDFSKYTPDIVLINLGTNDSSAINSGVEATEDSVKQAALDFCNRIREQYPDCKIVWLEGMMGNYNETYSAGVKAAIASLDNAYHCYLPHGRSGINNHPDVAEHQAASEVLYDFLVEEGLVTE